MNKIDLIKLLTLQYPSDLAERVIWSFFDIGENYSLEKWKYQGLEAGHFVENIRRLIEFELFSEPIDFSKRLNNFNYWELQRYEWWTWDDSYRMLIPQALKVIYSIRSKRWIWHSTSFIANKIDATLILSSAKWILAEIIRMNSSLDIETTTKLVEDIVDKKIDIIWDIEWKSRILKNEISTEKKILLLLYRDNKKSSKWLQESIEYSHSTKFKKILSKLHKNRLIEFDVSTNICMISPTWILEAEKIIDNI